VDIERTVDRGIIEMEEVLKTLIRRVLGARPAGAPPEAAPAPGADGAAWVREGRVFVRDPEPGGRPAVLIPAPEVQVLVNDREIAGPTEVRATERIEVIPRVREVPGRVTVQVAPDRLSATVELVPRRVERYHLVDSEPTPDLLLQVVADVELQCPLSYEEMLVRLVEQGVVRGINHALIKELVEKPREGRWVVAEGEAPLPPGDEWLEVPWLKESAGHPGERVDFRDFRRIPSVESGDLLAVRQPAAPGSPGMGVDGQPVPPPEPRRLTLKAGFGARLSEDGHSVVATVSGRPAIEEYGDVRVIRVDPVLVHEGDVDLNSGNIRFKGNVKILGNVQDGMTVQASGTVEILGLVSGAHIYAGGSVLIIRENVVSSAIQAGPPTAWKELAGLLEELHAQMKQLYQAAHLLYVHPQVKAQGVRYGHLVLVLLENKFTRIPVLVGKVKAVTDASEVPVPPEMDLLWQKIRVLGGLRATDLPDEGALAALMGEVAAVASYLRSQEQKPTDVILKYAANSRIEATGKVLVTGQGCFNTNIYAGGSVEINGVFRGGEIVAGGRVNVREAGSELGVRTVIRVPENHAIKLGKAYENVLLRVGDQTALLAQLSLAVEARLDARGRLDVNALPLEPEAGS